jgi:hypothetical protein
MRKVCLLSFILLLVASTYSQQAVPKITKTYFRSDPFEGEFSSFMTHLLNDPAITGKILQKRTDSSLFYFQGTYKNFNPFFFKPTRVQVVLTELPVDLDSLAKDTIYNYQLFAYNNDTKDGVHDVKKEFDKLLKRFKGSFLSNQYSETPGVNGSAGATYNFFDGYHAVAPFAITWFGPTENKEMCLVLTVRLDTRYNEAILPVPFYAPK